MNIKKKTPDTRGSYVTSAFISVQSTEMSNPGKNQHLFFLWYVSESQKIYACTDGMERRTKRVIPGFRPVRSLLDAVGPSLLSATDLASRYGIEGEICRPLNYM